MPKACWMARINVRDPADYATAAAAARKQFGGKSLIRGGGVTASEGEAQGPNLTEFSRRRAALDSHQPKNCQEARRRRLAAPKRGIVIVEGVEPE